MKKFYPIFKRLFVATFLCLTLGSAMALTYTVTSTADDGSPGTLRDAINQVNAGTFNVIAFDFHLLGTAPYTISLVSDLPAITNPVTIDGYSEPSAAQGTIASRTISINIDGGATNNYGLTISSSNVTVSGLAIYDNGSNGILITPGFNNVTIWGNYIGTLSNGTSSGFGNGSSGISIGALDDVTTNSNIVIGTNGDGTNDANEGNLIVGNGAGGLLDGGIVAYNTRASKFSGNIVGLSKDGVTPTNFGNNGSGIVISDRSSGNLIGTNGDGTSDALEQNISSNNSGHGVRLVSNTLSNTVAGNILGLTSTGAVAGNIGYGISIDNSAFNIIGTNADGNDDAQERNFISGNLSGGVLITSGNLGSGYDADANGNVISGNTIGLALDNATAAGNAGDGVTILATVPGFNVSENVIGSDGGSANEPAKTNTIASNSFNAITMTDQSASAKVAGNRVSRNSIFNNAGQGIVLTNPGVVSGTGVTPNQPNGFDFSFTYPNLLFNFPVITTVTNDPNNVIFQGYAPTGALLEFYLSDKNQTNPTPPAGLTANFGQGKTLLFQAIQGGTLNGITDAGNSPASYGPTQEGTGTSGSTVTSDKTFSFSVPNTQLNLTDANLYTFSAVAIDYAATTGDANNTSAFGGNSDATFTTLPVNLISFSGREDGSKVDLQWKTSNEVNNQQFDVQRSADGSAFATIGTVKGEGTTDVAQTYAFTDTKPNPNLNYYRLRQVDLDGNSTFSKVLVFRNTVTSNVQVYPTIFIDNINVTVKTPTADELQIRVIDQTGRLIQSYMQPTGAGLNSFNLNAGLERLAPGAYVLSIVGHTVSYTQQVIKN